MPPHVVAHGIRTLGEEAIGLYTASKLCLAKSVSRFHLRRSSSLVETDVAHVLQSIVWRTTIHGTKVGKKEA